MDLSGLRQVQDQKQQQAKEAMQESRNSIANLGLQETIVRTAKMVVDYMDGKVTKTAVINQIEGYATSQDSKEITTALGSLHETLKKHENVDITPLTEVMNNVLKEVKGIPKDHAETEEQKFVDYTEQFSELSKLIGKVESAVQAQETNVEAPVVNVDAPVVKVDAPDLKPLTKDLKAIEGAIKKIVIPAQIPTDTTKIEKELKASNKLLKEIRDTPGGGGGGSSSIAPFLVNGALPVSLANVTTVGTITNTVPTKQVRSATPTQSSPSVTTASTVILASNANRLGATIINEGSVACFVKLGATASATSYSVNMAVGGYFEVPFNYTGAIDGITASSTATLRVSELVA